VPMRWGLVPRWWHKIDQKDQVGDVQRARGDDN
jgi:putative SOS response-associated peptidase YedK